MTERHRCSRKSLGIALALVGTSTAVAQELDSLEPDLELLEFLGSFETDEGEWIPPENFLTEDFQELLNLAARMDEISGNAGNDDTDQNAENAANAAQQDN